MYLPVRPPSISPSEISQPFSENSTSALPALPVIPRLGWTWGTRFTQFLHSPLIVCSTSRGGLRRKSALLNSSLFCLDCPFQATVPPSSGCSGPDPGPRARPLQDQEGTAALKARETRAGWGKQLHEEVGWGGGRKGVPELWPGLGLWPTLTPTGSWRSRPLAPGSALSPAVNGS